MSRESEHHDAVSWTTCPECGHLAEILWGADRLDVDLVKVQCLQRHWFLMPGVALPSSPAWPVWRADAA